jgi:hypothetical protein
MAFEMKDNNLDHNQKTSKQKMQAHNNRNRMEVTQLNETKDLSQKEL